MSVNFPSSSVGGEVNDYEYGRVNGEEIRGEEEGPSLEKLQERFVAITQGSTKCSTAAVVESHRVFQTSSKGVSKSSQFFIGSVTKHMTAYILLAVLHEKYPRTPLDELLHQKLDSLFPHSLLLKAIDKGWVSEVTLLDLLTHRSGLTDYLDLYYTNYQILKLLEAAKCEDYPAKINELIEGVSNTELLYKIQGSAPTYDRFIALLRSGEYDSYIDKAKELNGPVDPAVLFRSIKYSHEKRYSYSNSGYLLIAKLIEEAAGKPFDVLFQEKIAIPANMTLSCAPTAGNYHDHQKTRSLTSNSGLLGKEEIFTDMANAVGAGNVISTGDDLMKWGAYFFKSAPKVIVDAILRNYGVDPDDDIINLGLATSQTDHLGELTGHQGGIDSFSSFFGYAPQTDILIIILSNDHDDANALMESLTFSI
ncbi:MAG: serine hydrolase [Chlamydiales bacterium]|nr:serine hydrolase [Chlamydiales bacterium]